LRRQEPYPITFTQQQISGTIEQMILVPLAENCLKHSDLDLNEQGYVKMTLSSDKEGLLFETENTFDRNQHKESGGGVGLQNMRERLSLIYGDKASLNVQEEDNLFKVQLRLIWKKQ
jgi:LytS/YehU family sensor histidine kinase